MMLVTVTRRFPINNKILGLVKDEESNIYIYIYGERKRKSEGKREEYFSP